MAVDAHTTHNTQQSTAHASQAHDHRCRHPHQGGDMCSGPSQNMRKTCAKYAGICAKICAKYALRGEKSELSLPALNHPRDSSEGICNPKLGTIQASNGQER